MKFLAEKPTYLAAMTCKLNFTMELVDRAVPTDHDALCECISRLKFAQYLPTCARFKDFFDLVCFRNGSRCCFLSFERSSFPIGSLHEEKEYLNTASIFQ